MSIRVNLKSTAATGHRPALRKVTKQTDLWIGSGCSTTDPLWLGGNGLRAIARRHFGVSSGYDMAKSTISGSSMKYREGTERGVPDPLADMSLYCGLLIGDNPNNDTAYSDRNVTDPSNLTVLKYARACWAAGVELILWNTLPRRDGTTGHAVVGNLPTREYAMWQIKIHEDWADACNQFCPVGVQRTRVIPACNVYVKIWDDIAAGVAPMTWDDMYFDTVHPSDHLGNYVLQVTAAAVLWNIDPKTVPNSYSTLTVSQAHGAYVRGVISDVVKGYQRAGVDTAGWT